MDTTRNIYIHQKRDFIVEVACTWSKTLMKFNRPHQSRVSRFRPLSSCVGKRQGLWFTHQCPQRAVMDTAAEKFQSNWWRYYVDSSVDGTGNLLKQVQNFVRVMTSEDWAVFSLEWRFYDIFTKEHYLDFLLDSWSYTCGMFFVKIGIFPSLLLRVCYTSPVAENSLFSDDPTFLNDDISSAFDSNSLTSNTDPDLLSDYNSSESSLNLQPITLNSA